jgi:hypothetical protein
MSQDGQPVSGIGDKAVLLQPSSAPDLIVLRGNNVYDITAFLYGASPRDPTPSPTQVADAEKAIARAIV